MRERFTSITSAAISTAKLQTEVSAARCLAAWRVRRAGSSGGAEGGWVVSIPPYPTLRYAFFTQRRGLALRQLRDALPVVHVMGQPWPMISRARAACQGRVGA